MAVAGPAPHPEIAVTVDRAERLPVEARRAAEEQAALAQFVHALERGADHPQKWHHHQQPARAQAKPDQRALSQASYHQAFWGETEPRNDRMLTPAKAINHTDEELEYLARLVNQRTAWQIAGKKGVKDGKGYMEEKPGQGHPADRPAGS